MRPIHRIQGTSRSGESGQIIVLVAVMAIVISAIVGLAVDVGRLYATKAQLSRAVDAAALSGILEFNGTTAGLTAAENKAVSYFNLNEPGNLASVSATANGNDSTLTLNASKSVNMTFLSLLNLGPVTVTAHAKAGFGTQYLDTVMVLDATQSMVGNPITQAKTAATTFKNILLGANPQGNVKVGVTAFRGCFKANSTSTEPDTNCIDRANWVRGLTSSSANLNTTINNIAGGGGNAGTNVCTGLAMGWRILDDSTTNHKNDVLFPGNRQYLILLSDGDNYYPGENVYVGPQGVGADPPTSTSSSPLGATVNGQDYLCSPIDTVGGTTGTACPSPWNSLTPASTYPCYKGVYAAGASETWESTDFAGGTGWLAGSWTRSSTTLITNSTTAAQGGSQHLKMAGSNTSTTVSEDWDTNTWTGGSNWLAAQWTLFPTSTTAATTASTAPQGGTRHLRLSQATTTNPTEDFETTGFTGGTNFGTTWTRSNTTQITSSTSTPQGGSRLARFFGTSSSLTTNMYRQLDLSNITSASMTYYLRRSSTWADTFLVQLSSDCGSWTTIKTYSGASALTTTNTQYSLTTAEMAPYIGDSSVCIRFVSTTNATTDEVFLDTLVVTRTIADVSVTRTVDLSGLTDASLTYYARRNTSFGTGDILRAEASGDGVTWTALQTHSGTALTTSYVQFTSPLTAFLGDSSVYIRFRGTMNSTSDEAYVDTVNITRTTAASAINVYRTINLGSVTDATLGYYIRRNATFGAGDEVRVQASGDGTTWTTLLTHAGTALTTSYAQQSVDLSAFVGDSSVYIRFESAIAGASDEAYIDTITVTFTSGTTGNADGYLNGNDNSNPSTCNEYPRPRERQLDSRTLKLAQAMKKEGVEIFVVAFTTDTIPGCNLGNTTIYNDEVAAECNAVDQTTAPNPITTPAGNGPIGDGTHDGTANHRLLKCIASNTQGSLDHYFFAATAGELNVIFTTIANQISHRLIE